MKRVCGVAYDIAFGMASLHKRNVVHGGALHLPTRSCWSSWCHEVGHCSCLSMALLS